MPLTPQDLERRLVAALAPARLEVIDESAAHAGHSGANAEGWGTHFRVRIAAPSFENKSRVQRHRLVYDALADCQALGLHALAIDILPTDETR
ncbi:MAG: DNA-binding transcriptional regulator BolA [Paracidovorax wautersii]|uniref:DNA-binding transcriptional regulator BolA n=1 Tax=Paracidovorax wautersii TaxID=1177982 RepID=A0A7V8FLT8_9BURK|nr:MAG: DNA-binding transcriptional regulator BolA [Paracidovorax wautersii]